MRRRWVVTGTVTAVAVVITAGLAAALARPDHTARSGSATVRTITEAPARVLTSRRLQAKTCPSRVARSFAPRTITVSHVVQHAAVITPPRDARGVPGVPPLTNAGKLVFAFDRGQGIEPGDAHGNALLNTHTWPDGSALGNKLLAGLHRGGRIIAYAGHTRLCYRVTERLEVSADANFTRYYATSGRPQLAIVVCSGQRLGPGLWTKRTVWFASPSA